MSNSFVIPWTVAHRVPLSMEFLSQEYWSGLPFASPGDLPNQGIQGARFNRLQVKDSKINKNLSDKKQAFEHHTLFKFHLFVSFSFCHFWNQEYDHQRRKHDPYSQTLYNLYEYRHVFLRLSNRSLHINIYICIRI